MSFEGYESQLRELGECLREKTLIPFIGAGLSQPFEVPMWDSLIEDIANEFVESDYLPAVKSHLKQKKYFKAVDSIIDFGIKDELEIQEKIVEIIKRKVSTDIDNSSHNYSDLAEMG
ncbi:MAG: hypothetical protein N2509_09295, partial [Treponemataceae bacterium]|nr:hypothetical protein [Treponemataceae bacterium]